MIIYFVDINEAQDSINFIDLYKKYDWVGNFNEEDCIARVKVNGKYGVINEDGEEIIPPIYDMVSVFSKGFSFIVLNKKMGLINKNGTIIIPCKYDGIGVWWDTMTFEIKLNNKFGLIGLKGEEIIPLIYDDYILFNQNENLVVTNKGNTCGFIDLNTSTEFIEFDNIITHVGEDGDSLYYKEYKDTYIFRHGYNIGFLDELEKYAISQSDKDSIYYKRSMDIINLLKR